MRVFFATTPFRQEAAFNIPTEPLLGIFILSEILRDYGCQVDVVLDLATRLKQGPEEIVAQALKADLICLSAMSFNWAYIKEFMELVEQAGERPPMIVGGVHPTLLPEHVMRFSLADVAVVGEGEHAILELVDHFRGQRPLEEIRGIYYRRDGQILSTAKRELLTSEELGRLPCVRWDDYPSKPKCLSVQTSRGCWMNCAFCSVPFRQSWRPFPVQHILGSLQACLKIMPGEGPKTIVFADDCFTPDQQFATDVLQAVAEQFPQTRLSIEGRVRDLLRPGFLEALSASTVESIQVGVECGYDEGLKRVRKIMKTKDVEDLGHRAKEIGIAQKLRYSYIIGFPWETTAEMETTIDFAFGMVNRYGGHMQINWWSLMPGNSLFQEVCESYGLDTSIFDHKGWNFDRALFSKIRPWLNKEVLLHIQRYCYSVASSQQDASAAAAALATL